MRVLFKNIFGKKEPIKHKPDGNFVLFGKDTGVPSSEVSDKAKHSDYIIFALIEELGESFYDRIDKYIKFPDNMNSFIRKHFEEERERNRVTARKNFGKSWGE